MPRFWDSSAIIPLLSFEPTSSDLRTLLSEDNDMVVWWVTRVECASALARRRREGRLESFEQDRSRAALDLFAGNWTEIDPSLELRSMAEGLLTQHHLRAADALQLAAALAWCQNRPEERGFVCVDTRLRTAARVEGFTIAPVA